MQRRLINGAWFQVRREWRDNTSRCPLVELGDGTFMLCHSRAGQTHVPRLDELISYLEGDTDSLVRALKWHGSPEAVDTAKVIEVLWTFDFPVEMPG